MQFAAIDLVTILALAGTGLIVTAALGGGIQVKEITIPSISKPIRIVSGIVGVGLLSAAFHVHFQTMPEISPPESMAATFEYPPPNTHIPLKTELRGTLKPALPEGGRYWIVMRDDDGDYYPQARLAPSQAGAWTHSLTLGREWGGRSSKAVIVFAPQQADQILLGINEEEKLSSLPEGSVVLAELDLNVE